MEVLSVLSYLIHKPYIILTTFAGSFTGLLIILLYGISSNSLMDSSDQKLIGTMTVAALVGALSSIWTIHNIGPKHTLILSSGLFIVGSILIEVDPLVAKAIYGAASGLSYLTGPIYVSGFSPPSIKNALMSVTGLFTTVASVILYLLNLNTSNVINIFLRYSLFLCVLKIFNILKKRKFNLCISIFYL